MDDYEYFPQYLAVPFFRSDLPDRAITALSQLEGVIDEERMRELNSQTIIDGKTFAEVAEVFLTEQGFNQITRKKRVYWSVLDLSLIHI